MPVDIVADNPASILIVLGFLGLVAGIMLTNAAIAILGGGSLALGVFLHLKWLDSR